MPRDSDKNNNSRGRRDRPVRRQRPFRQAARGPEKKFAKRGFGARTLPARAATSPRRAASLAAIRRREAVWQDALFAARASLRRQAAVQRRDDRPRGSTPRPRFNRGDRPSRDRRRAKSARSSHARIAAARAPVQPRGDRRSMATTERRAGSPPRARVATMPVRRGASSDRKFGDKKPYRFAGTRRREATLYAARRAFSKDASVLAAIVPMAHGRRRRKSSRAAIGRERKFGVVAREIHDRGSARSQRDRRRSQRVRRDRRPRRDFGDRPKSTTTRRQAAGEAR